MNWSWLENLCAISSPIRFLNLYLKSGKKILYFVYLRFNLKFCVISLFSVYSKVTISNRCKETQQSYAIFSISARNGLYRWRIYLVIVYINVFVYYSFDIIATAAIGRGEFSYEDCRISRRVDCKKPREETRRSLLIDDGRVFFVFPRYQASRVLLGLGNLSSTARLTLSEILLNVRSE